MTKLLFAGSRTDCVSVVNGSLAESTAYINTSYSDAGIDIASGTAKIQFYDPAAAPLLSPYSVADGATLYFHCYIGFNFSGPGYGNDLFIFYDNSNHPWLKFQATGQWYYNSGTGTSPVWTAVGTNTYGLPGANRNPATMDVQVQLNSSGNHQLFMAVNSIQAVAQVEFTQPLMTNLSYCTMNSSTADCVVSQLLATENISTIGGFVQTSRATGPGAHSDWSGTYTNVNEVITNLSEYNQALTAGLKQSYPMSNITVPAGCNIQGVFYWLIMKNDGTSPQNIDSLAIASAGVDHVSADLNDPSIAFAGIGARYDVNPDTSAAWTQAIWNAPVQLGFVSEA